MAAKWLKVVFAIVAVLFIEETLRNAGRYGDYIGYTIAGNYVLNGENLYSHWLNTWPPVFSIFTVPIAIFDSIAPLLTRIVWQSLMLLACYGLWQEMARFFLAKRIGWSEKAEEDGCISIWTPWLMVSFLLSFKFLLDNSANLQVNVLMLFLALKSARLNQENKLLGASFLLGLSIALKVYTIFFLIWLLFQRQWRMSALTLVWIALISALCLPVFGLHQTLDYYKEWWTTIANAYPMLMHKNQSLLGAFWRFTVNEDPGIGFTLNVIDLSIDQSKKLFYLVVSLIALIPAWHWRTKIRDQHSSLWKNATAVILTLTPLLSPLSWKAYYVFLIPLIFWQLANWPTLEKGRRILFVVGTVLIWIGADAFVGPRISDISEAISIIPIGAILMVFSIKFKPVFVK